MPLMRSSALRKKCLVCGIILEHDFFYKRKDSSDGLRNDCKSCVKKRSAAAYYSDIDEMREKNKSYYRKRVKENPNFQKEAYWADPEKSRKENRDYYAKHRDKRLAAAKEYAVKNRGKSNAAKKRYKLAKTRAIPPWVNVCFGARVKIENIYRRAQELTDSTGTQHHVDHIIPLRGKNVSGLHAPNNLQILTATDNMRKSNRVNT